MKHDLLQLVHQAQSGDALAFDALVRRFQDMAFGYALSVVSDRTLAEDAAQEAFVEAYRCLPSLREAAAFPGWLRRLVFKHCDRATRGGEVRRLLPLDAARDVAADADRADPAALAERRQESRRVRDAVRALPDGEREVTALFYLGGSATREIAGFLDVPEATVRTRLHRARQRLRKELIAMEEENVTATERPSESGRFADRVLEEIAQEYRRQRKADPETADRSLLAQAKRRLEGYLQGDTPLARETVVTGEKLLTWMGEDAAAIALLRRFLGQKLTVSEEAWARFFLVNVLSGVDPQECVAEHEKMIRWARATFPTDPPRLRYEWDFEPTDDPAAETYPVDTLGIWTLYIPDAPRRWADIGRGAEWIELFYDTLRSTPATNTTRLARFHFMRTGIVLLVGLSRTEEAWALADRVAALADEVTDEADRLNWRGYGAHMRLLIAGLLPDKARYGAEADAAVAALEHFERAVTREHPLYGRFSILRDNIASNLSDAGLHERAIPLLEAQIAAGSGSAWNYARLAASRYAVAGDRAEALRLLRQGALRVDRSSLWDWCRTRPPFTDVADDPEFAAAAARAARG